MPGFESHQREHGIALVLVLWLTALLGLMAAAYATTSRTETQMTTIMLQRAEARALAEAGIWRGILELSRPLAQRQWQTDGRVNRFRFAGHGIAVRLIDEAGKIDLNTGRAELFAGLFAAVGLEETRQQALTDALLDWRDRDHLKRTHGVEDADYRAAGRDYGAKDGPFNSVSELRLVAGIDDGLFRKIAPALTVYSHQPGVHPEVAAELPLRALPGASAKEVRAYIAQRSSATGTLATLDGVHPRFLSRTQGQTYTVISSASLGQVTSTLSAIVASRPAGDVPYRILAWMPATSLPAPMDTGAANSP